MYTYRKSTRTTTYLNILLIYNLGVAPLRNIFPVIPNLPATKNAKSRKRLTGPFPVSKAPTNLEAFMIASVGGLRVFEYDCNASLTLLGFFISAGRTSPNTSLKRTRLASLGWRLDLRTVAWRARRRRPTRLFRSKSSNCPEVRGRRRRFRKTARIASKDARRPRACSLSSSCCARTLSSPTSWHARTGYCWRSLTVRSSKRLSYAFSCSPRHREH